ncbi:MAG TPA: hypothetical protein VF075_02665 [Pyrinomonadaceae bacterium]
MSAHRQLLRPAGVERIHSHERWWRVLRLLHKLRYLIPPFFVCWHIKMSRPFTRDGESYRVCLRCGVRRRFDLQEWKTKGDYYHASETQTRGGPSPEIKPLHLVQAGSKDDPECCRFTVTQRLVEFDGKRRTVG